MRTMVLLALLTLAALAWWRWSRRTAAPTAAAAARATKARTVASHPDWEPWWNDMLRCDGDKAERGSILWFSDALQLELRLCLHHSKIHAADLGAAGWERLRLGEEVAV